MTGHYSDPDAKIAELNRHIRVLEDLTEYETDYSGAFERLNTEVDHLSNRVTAMGEFIDKLTDKLNELVYNQMAAGFNQMGHAHNRTTDAYRELVKALPGMIAAGVAAGLRPEPPKPPAPVVRLTPRPKPPGKGPTS